ncbi:hypothetical protein ACFSC6_07880 [Rufibacter sediminis]|uniref:Uncharacterized protein n=1 Tax=Rufibacter sediminis TaxID=2762756 RepID=A0ABR6VQ37_9BACT|nr:hypothetical protein [Rufibacter sediminis]MBC3539261.1 hypothetical protein [Rufibacter sediminis]
MKKGFFVIALVSILSLISLYLFRPSRDIEVRHVERFQTTDEMRADSSLVSVYDEDGNLIYTRQDTASETTKQVNTSLNGMVFYKLARGKEYVKTEVFKYDYRKENYYVTFSNDTVSASAPFEASISRSGDGVESAKVIISNAKKYNVEKIAGKYGVKLVYKAKSQQPGVNTFDGTIILQNQQYQIRFNYFVK